MKEVSKLIAALWMRRGVISALPRLGAALLWGGALLFFPFAGARIGSWVLVGEALLAALWWCGAHKGRRRHAAWLLPAAALIYVIFGRPDVAAGLAAGGFAAAAGIGMWTAAEKKALSSRVAGGVSLLCAAVFFWKAPTADYIDLAPVYALYLFAAALWFALDLKIAGEKS